jgi:hypothetical protein
VERDGGLGEVAPGGRGVQALHHGGRAVGRAHGFEAGGSDLLRERRGAQHQDRRARSDAPVQVGDGGLGGRDDVVVVRRDPQLVQVRGDRPDAARGVVGHERDPHPRGPGTGDRLGSVRDRLLPEVQDPVEVEQTGVVRAVQRPVARAEQPTWGSLHQRS